MKLKYQAKKRTRINHSFIGITPESVGYWYNLDKKIWECNPEHGLYRYSKAQRCNSIKAFRRKLKKAPKGVRFILVSRFKGYNVIGKGSNN